MKPHVRKADYKDKWSDDTLAETEDTHAGGSRGGIGPTPKQPIDETK
jgi:hypothetical protein